MSLMVFRVEAEAVKKVFEDVGKALELIVNDNIDEAMNKYSK